MGRRLLNLLTALSLLLCVAVVALWVRNWNATGPAGESAAWAAALDVKPPTPRPAIEPAQTGDIVTVDIDDLEGPGLLTQKVERVGTDGTIRLPYLGKLPVRGLTGSQIQANAKAGYRRAVFIDYEYVRVSVATGDVRLPYRVLVASFALLPLAWLFWGFPSLRGWRGRRRLSFGLCPNCGYDLRTTPGRCPECGLRLHGGVAGGGGLGAA